MNIYIPKPTNQPDFLVKPPAGGRCANHRGEHEGRRWLQQRWGEGCGHGGSWEEA